MIVAGLITLFSILFGGSEVALFVQDLPKYVKKYVTDPERKEIALETINGYLTNVKDHNARNKGFVKELNSMMVDPMITLESFETFMDLVFESRKEIQVAYVKMRVDLSESITDGEWKSIIDEGAPSYQKHFEKKKKDKEKFDKLLNKISENILNHLESEESKAAAQKVLNSYNSELKKLAQEKVDYDLYSHPELMVRVIDFDSFLLLISETNIKRDLVFATFTTTFFEIKEIATEEEWTKIAKEFTKYY